MRFVRLHSILCSPLFWELASERLQPGSEPQAPAAFLICCFQFHFNDHRAVSHQAGRAGIDKSKSSQENRPGTICVHDHHRSGGQAFLVCSSWTQLTKCSSPSARNIHQRLRPSSPVARLQPHLCISDLGAHHC